MAIVSIDDLHEAGEILRKQAYADTCNMYAATFEELSNNEREAARVESNQGMKTSKMALVRTFELLKKYRKVSSIALPFAIFSIAFAALSLIQYGVSSAPVILLVSTALMLCSIIFNGVLLYKNISHFYTQYGCFEAASFLADYRGLTKVDLDHPLF